MLDATDEVLKMPDETLSKLGIYYGTLQRMTFMQFVEAVDTKRLEINFNELEVRLAAMNGAEAMDRFEQALWGERETAVTTVDEIDAYKTKRDMELEDEYNGK